MGAMGAKTFKNTGLLQVPKAPWNASRNCNIDNTPANMQMKFVSQKQRSNFQNGSSPKKHWVSIKMHLS